MTGNIFLVASTQPYFPGITDYLQHIGASDWTSDGRGGELVSEIAGRLCYKSFAPGLNPNVTRVREGNSEYLGNIIRQKHGSVFEHSTASLIFTDVSRIFTHELVRHRPGIAISQESQRFVRLDTFDVYIPELTPVFMKVAEYALPTEDPADYAQFAQQRFAAIMDGIAVEAREALKGLANDLMLNWDQLPFHLKKQLTSAFRRGIPGGVNTAIMVTGNHRIWRHVIQNRTSAGAEEEIAHVFGQVAVLFSSVWPAFYQDMVSTPPNADCPWTQYAFVAAKI